MMELNTDRCSEDNLNFFFFFLRHKGESFKPFFCISVIAQHIGPNITSDLPAVILFSTKWQQKTGTYFTKSSNLTHTWKY